MSQNAVNPLSWNVPIVNKDGTPTQEFQRKWLQQAATNTTIPVLSTIAQVSAVLDILSGTPDDILVRGATLWGGVDPTTLFDPAGAAAAAQAAAETFATGAANAALAAAEAFSANAGNLSSGTVPVARLPIATTVALGGVIPDGSTITVDPDGTIHSSGGSGGAGVPPQAPGYQAGRYYTCHLWDSATSNAVPGGNKLFYIPFCVTAAWTFTGIGTYVSVAVTSAKVRFGIYTSVNRLPSALVYDCGEVAAAVVGGAQLTGLSLALTPGWYFLAMGVPATATPNLLNMGGNNWLFPFNGESNTHPNWNTAQPSITSAWTYTSPPTALPNPAPSPVIDTVRSNLINLIA